MKILTLGRRLLGQITSAEVEHLRQELSVYRMAFETTAADRDARLGEVERYRQAYEKALVEVEQYKHAYETTAIDRDRISGDLAVKTRLDINDSLALFAYSLLIEQRLSPDALLEELSRAIANIHSLDDLSGSAISKESLADRLIDLANFILTRNLGSKFALDLVTTSRALSKRFRGTQTALDYYFQHISGLSEHIKYYEDAIAQGEWPDEYTRKQQQKSIERGIPGVLLATLPKSGSIFLWTAISNTLNLPMVRVAVTEKVSMFDERIIPRALQWFAEGGLSAQQHMSPVGSNLALLRQYGVTKFILHFRDPRQAAVSWWHYAQKTGQIHAGYRQEEIEEEIWNKYLIPSVEWLKSWVSIADQKNDFDIYLSTHEDMRKNEMEHIERIFDFMNIPKVNIKLPGKSGNVHFRKGASDEWIDFFSNEFKQRTLDIIPPRLAQRFGWVDITRNSV